MRPGRWGAAIALALFLAAVPAAAATGPGEGVTIETSAGPVTCAPDPEHEPGTEAISTTPFAHGMRIAITETGALRCQIPTLGEVEVTGAGLPWQLTLNERKLTARLKGAGKPGLVVQPVGVPLSCLYQAGKVLGTLALGASPTVSISVTSVKLNRSHSSGLCPALGPLDLGFTLPLS